MANVVARDLDSAVLERVKARAAEQGRSLQKELKLILEEAVVAALQAIETAPMVARSTTASISLWQSGSMAGW